MCYNYWQVGAVTLALVMDTLIKHNKTYNSMSFIVVFMLYL